MNGSMSQGVRRRARRREASACRVCLLALALFASLPSCLAGPTRVTTWNLGLTGYAGTNEVRLQEVADVLKQLNPDVILLQEVGGWPMCRQLAQALKPAQYTVHVCSAFREARTGTLSDRQVAILSKAKAYFSWSACWRPQDGMPSRGGFAFAALQMGRQRFGFFSVEVGATAEDRRSPGEWAAVTNAPVAAGAQLLEQVRLLGNWETNRVEAFVVGATFDTGREGWLGVRDHTLRVLEAAEFGDAFREMSAPQPVTVAGGTAGAGVTADYILTQPVGCAADPGTVALPVSGHYPVTCEVDLDPVKLAVARAVRAEAMRARQAPPQDPTPAAMLAPQPSSLNYQLLWLGTALGAIVALAISVSILARRRQLPAPRPPALLTAGGDIPTSYTVVVGTMSAAEPASAPPSAAPAAQPVIHVEAAESTHTEAEVLRQRALAAERRADQAQAVVRAGLLPHLGQWLKQKLVRKLIADREQLLATQQAAAQKVRAVEERLSRIERQVRRQNDTYQARIEALTRELLTAKEENRELIRARIAQVKAEMAAARRRLVAQPSGAGPDADPPAGEGVV
jgi:hypothetical protein